MQILNMKPRLAERGRIKIGMKGEMRTSSRGKEFQPPKKLDYFLITTAHRDEKGNFIPDEELMALYKPDDGGKLRRLPVMLLYNDIELNFESWYAAYKGTRLWCIGNGKEASRLGEGMITVDQATDPQGVGGRRPAKAGERGAVVCPCPCLDADYKGETKCKPNGTLQMMLIGSERIGGVWRFRTTSWNSISSIMGSLALIKIMTGGILAGIPLDLVLAPKTVVTPVDGKTQTVFVVSLEYKGTETSLLTRSYELAELRAKHHARIQHIEELARKMLMGPDAESPDEVRETKEEFYPETVELELARETGRCPVEGCGLDLEDDIDAWRCPAGHVISKGEATVLWKAPPEPPGAPQGNAEQDKPAQPPAEQGSAPQAQAEEASAAPIEVHKCPACGFEMPEPGPCPVCPGTAPPNGKLF